MKSCIICIPIHKIELNLFERISLQQCNYILKDYKKVFVIPDSLDVNFGNEYKNYGIEKFPDIYFSCVKSYNELCLTEEFYERFIAYDYMLLYQLDSFVFYDNLKYFCDLEYDYIGAPLFYMGFFEIMNMNVGNGGFSLRNIKRILKVLKEQKGFLNHSKMSGVFNSNEDVFYGYCGSRDAIDFRVPNIEIAQKFAQEMMLKDYGTGLTRENLPFGTHAWDKINYHIWKPFIESYGYRLPPEEEVQFIDESRDRPNWEIYSKILKSINKVGRDRIKIPFQSCSVWGAGYYGKRCLRVLRALDIHVNYVFDWNNNALDYSEDLDYTIYPPTVNNLMENQDMLLVAVREIDNEIQYKMDMRGTKRFLFYEDFIKDILYNILRTPYES